MYNLEILYLTEFFIRTSLVALASNINISDHFWWFSSKTQEMKHNKLSIFYKHLFRPQFPDRSRSDFGNSAFATTRVVLQSGQVGESLTTERTTAISNLFHTVFKAPWLLFGHKFNWCSLWKLVQDKRLRNLGEAWKRGSNPKIMRSFMMLNSRQSFDECWHTPFSNPIYMI